MRTSAGCYIGLYASLRTIGAPSQKFIYLIIAVYWLVAFSTFRRATTTAQPRECLELFLSTGWLLAFLAVAIRGARRNISDVRNRLQRDREAAISIQTEAMLRAHEHIRRNAPP